ncbi:MAG TPA: TlpA disulfide reductase family protein [Tepidisphaeraceae bacterium]|nr:TlpA disulfide reductase family protein [Tepidisphaeraceae bacterium]
MRRIFLLLPALIAFIAPAPPASGAVQVGDAPELKTVALDGTRIDLSTLRDKIVLIDFWIATSQANKENERALAELHKVYEEKGVAFIGIAAHPKADVLRQVIADLGVTWPQVHVPTWREGLGAQWGVPRVNWVYLIAPGGKVVFIGDASKVKERLDWALETYPPKLVSDDVLAKAKQDLETVEALLNDKDRDGAVRKFTRIAEEATKDREFARRAMAVREKINEAADAMLREVDDLVAARRFAAAAQRLRELLSVMAGLPTASLARQHLAELVSRPEIQHELAEADRREKAQAALDEARKLRDAGQEDEAYARFRAVAEDFKQTPAGQAAAEAAKAYESDPAFVRRNKDRAAATRAKPALNLAENYLAAGRPEMARKKYEEVVKEFPDTTFAETAKAALARIK